VKLSGAIRNKIQARRVRRRPNVWAFERIKMSGEVRKMRLRGLASFQRVSIGVVWSRGLLEGKC